MTLKTWINQDDCTSCAICEDIAPAAYQMDADRQFAYVKEADWQFITNGSDSIVYAGATGLATLREEDLEGAIEAATECPGECIYLEQI